MAGDQNQGGKQLARRDLKRIKSFSSEAPPDDDAITDIPDWPQMLKPRRIQFDRIRTLSFPIAVSSEPEIHKFVRQKTPQRESFFDLLGLPTEVRLLIFEYLLPEPVQTDNASGHPCGLNSNAPCALELPSMNPRLPVRGYSALLCTCTKLSSEASRVLYNSSATYVAGHTSLVLEVARWTVTVRGLPIFCETHDVYSPSAARLLSRLRNIVIRVIWTSACGIDSVREHLYWCVRWLRKSPRLSRLDLAFCDAAHSKNHIAMASLLEPFRTLRNIQNPDIQFLKQSWSHGSRFFGYKWQFQDACEECIQCARTKVVMEEMKDLLRSNIPVTEPKIFELYHDFKSAMSGWSPSLLGQAAKARKTNDAERFRKILAVAQIEYDRDFDYRANKRMSLFAAYDKSLR
ncbi:uncharacterized protein J3D65DRAFT_619521 [Phyllosticta citribraziliensis]|uniref:F-box domain-containing protein n=1 Tax=Phyllosticta citribraziliensis TaxID=989973 RepID=A0ABR1LYI5_9PEZI